MLLCYNNVDNSLLSKLDELKLQAYDKKYNIIALNEIKPKHGSIPDLKNLQITNYTLHTSNLELDETRGACIYIDNKYKSAEVIVENHDFKDAVTVEVIGSNNSKILITCIYRSGTPSTAAAKDEELHKMLKSISAIPGYQMKVIVGDFNLNKITWNPDPELPLQTSEESAEYKFIECIRDTFFYQHITEPTRYRAGNRPTCDDLLFTSYENNLTQLSYEAPLGKSDHTTITCTLHTEVKPIKSTRVIYNYNKGDYEKMKNMMSKDWDSLLNGKSVQEATNVITEEFKKAVDECIPKSTISNDSRAKPIWMNRLAFRKVKRKYSGWLRYLNTKQGESYQEYTRRRNESTHELRSSRRKYEKQIAKECRKNPKAVWRYIKSNNKVSSGVPNLKKTDGSFTSTDAEAADTLNQQYYNAFTKEDTTNIPNIPLKQLITPELSTFKVDEEDVKKDLKNLKPNKSPGIDGIHPRVLIETAEQVAHPITLIFKKSIDAGELPSHWLQALITPIFKKGSKTAAENYRPVSLTCILCKVLEKLIVKQIISHIRENQLVSLRQHGFTTGKSTTTNLLEVLNIWTEALMHHIPVDVLYLDYRKAFDTVPHRRLLNQVRSFGITGEALGWIEAFLSNRKQKVRVNGSESQWAPVLSGIPQGSILGPILFSLFVNDLPGEVKGLISLFADDSKMYIPLSSDDSAIQLQEDLWMLENWANKMQMQFHPLKCKVMHFGSNNKKADYYMHTVNGAMHKLEEAEVEKDLGVHIDNQLKFTKHCQEKVNTANRVLRSIKHTFRYLDEELFALLYKALVRPHLEYATCIWSPHLKYNIDAVERVQRRATKMIPTIKDLSYTDRLKKLKLETLEYRRKRADLLEVYRILNSQHNLDLHCHCQICPNKEMLTPTLSKTTRGHSKKLQIQEATGPRKHYFEARVASLWNQLSEITVTSKNITTFKANLSKDLPNKFNFKFSK